MNIYIYIYLRQNNIQRKYKMRSKAKSWSKERILHISYYRIKLWSFYSMESLQLSWISSLISTEPDLMIIYQIAGIHRATILGNNSIIRFHNYDKRIEYLDISFS